MRAAFQLPKGHSVKPGARSNSRGKHKHVRTVILVLKSAVMSDDKIKANEASFYVLLLLLLLSLLHFLSPMPTVFHWTTMYC